jgi:Domain of unknown function (DUF4329)
MFSLNNPLSYVDPDGQDSVTGGHPVNHSNKPTFCWPCVIKEGGYGQTGDDADGQLGENDNNNGTNSGNQNVDGIQRDGGCDDDENSSCAAAGNAGNHVDGYRNAAAAANAVLAKINPTSIEENKEYGGLIYKYRDADTGLIRYNYTDPVAAPNGRDSADNFNPHDSSVQNQVPYGSDIVGDYHTHGQYSKRGPGGKLVATDAAHDEVDSNHFSVRPDMKQIKRDAGTRGEYRGYLGTPSGKFYVYNPFMNQVDELK